MCTMAALYDPDSRFVDGWCEWAREHTQALRAIVSLVDDSPIRSPGLARQMADIARTELESLA